MRSNQTKKNENTNQKHICFKLFIRTVHSIHLYHLPFISVSVCMHRLKYVLWSEWMLFGPPPARICQTMSSSKLSALGPEVFRAIARNSWQTVGIRMHHVDFALVFLLLPTCVPTLWIIMHRPKPCGLGKAFSWIWFQFFTLVLPSKIGM